jgi:hypothetical protein
LDIDDTLFVACIVEVKLRTSKLVLTFLEKKYLDMTVSAEDVEMQATLKVAGEVAKFLREQVNL